MKYSTEWLTNSSRTITLNHMVKHSDEHLDAVFHALSDQTRRAILRQLTEREQSVSELAEPFRMSLAAVSKHIMVLENAGLVSKSKEGRMYRCQARLEPLKNANDVLSELADFWQGRLDALDRMFTRPNEEETHGTSSSNSRDSSEARHKKNHPRKKRTGV